VSLAVGAVPAPNREKTAIANATLKNPDRVLMHMKWVTHTAFGRAAMTSRFNRSGAPCDSFGAVPAFGFPSPDEGAHGVIPHEPVHAAPRHVVALPAQPDGHLPPPLHGLRFLRDVLRVDHDGIRDGPGGRRLGLSGPQGPCGDLHALLTHDLACRLDPLVIGRQFVDEAT
jgi:hypothetical protein